MNVMHSQRVAHAELWNCDEFSPVDVDGGDGLLLFLQQVGRVMTLSATPPFQTDCNHFVAISDRGRLSVQSRCKSQSRHGYGRFSRLDW